MTAALASIERIAKAHRKDWDEGTTTFRGQPISVVICENPSQTWHMGNNIPLPNKAVRFLPEGFTVIRVLKSEVSPLPKIGEAFTVLDEDGNPIITHRIQQIQGFKLSFLCLCKAGGSEG